MFRLDISSLLSSFAKISVTRINKYQRNVYYIDIGYDRETKINPSSQFKFKKSRKCMELKILLNKMNYKIKSFLRINTLLMSNNVKEQKINNDIVFLKNVLLVLTLNSYQAVNFMKNILSKNDLEDEYTLKIIIESEKDIQLMEQKD